MSIGSLQDYFAEQGTDARDKKESEGNFHSDNQQIKGQSAIQYATNVEKEASTFWVGFHKQAKLKSELQPHQERALQKFDKSKGLLVYHGLGAGKTLTGIAGTEGRKTDVIVPASLRTNFKKELNKHTVGSKRNVMSYEKSIKTPRTTADTLLIDEGQALGRSDTARSQEIMERAPEYEKRMILSGTPIRNHPSEIAPLMNIVRGDKALPTDPKAFSEKYIAEEKIQPGIFNRLFRGAKPGIRYRIKNPNQFEQAVKGYVDYYAPEKKNFPQVSHEVVEAPMSGEQMKYYKFIMGKAGPALRWKIRMGMPPSKTEAKQLNSFLSGARQVSNTTREFGGKDVSPKMERAVGELNKRYQKDSNFRGVVYSNYLGSGVKAYAEQLDKLKIPYAIFDGSLSDRARKRIIDDYNNGNTKVLLISGAGSQGLDLKGTKLVQLLEPHWNNPRLEQATGRAVRYGSHSHLPEKERSVHVQQFHSTVPKSFLQKITGGKQDKSVDQYLSMLSKEKEKLNNQFLDILKKVGGEP